MILLDDRPVTLAAVLDLLHTQLGVGPDSPIHSSERL